MSKNQHTEKEAAHFVLEAHEMGAFAKALTFWWLTPKRCVLKRIELRAGKCEVEMWNGTQHVFMLHQSQINWQKHQNGHRLIFVKNLVDGKKFRIVEFADMYPNGEFDFTRLLHVLNADQAWWYKIAKHFVPSPMKRVIDELTD